MSQTSKMGLIDALLWASAVITQINYHPYQNCVCGPPFTRNSISKKIIGGEDATSSDYPWMVRLVQGNGKVFCGGTLIADQWILTAAHCLIGKNGIRHAKVLVYSQDRFSVSKYISHPEFKNMKSGNDIALLKLSKRIRFSKFVAPACLPSARFWTNPNRHYSLGWGITDRVNTRAQKLQYLDLVEAQDRCTEVYGPDVTPDVICVENPGKDLCNGDSGGPLMTRRDGYNVLIGVFSSNSKWCTTKSPAMFTDVRIHITWIRNVINDQFHCRQPFLNYS